MVQIFDTLLETAFDSTGAIIPSAQLFVYEAGTTTKLTTYTDNAQSSAATNPLIADSAGRFATIYGNADDYKFVMAPADDTDPPTSAIKTLDNYTIASATTFSGGINTSGFTERLFNAQTGTSYTYLTGDRAKMITHSNASAIAGALPQANSTTFQDGWYILVTNIGAGTLTITPTTSTIDGAATLVLSTDESAIIVSDGTNYRATALKNLNEHVPNAQTGTTYTYLTGDRAKLVTHSNASAIAGTLPQANATTFQSGWYFHVHNVGAGTLTITPATSTINGNATLILVTGESAMIVSDGTNYQVSSLPFQVTNLTAVTTLQTTDQMAFADASDSSNNKKITIANFLTTLATTTTQAGFVEKATQAEGEGETADKYLDAASIKFNPGAAKAWANFDGDASPADLQEDHNFTSLTDVGTGLYTLNSAITMSTTTYAVTAISSDPAAAAASFLQVTDTGLSQTAIPLACRDDSATLRDAVIGCVAVHGDL